MPVNEIRVMDWKQFVASLVASLRWPVAFIIIIMLLREPFTAMLNALTRTIAS